MHEPIHINTKDLSIFHFYFTGILLFIFPDCKTIRRVFCLFTRFGAGWKCVTAFLHFQMRQKDTVSTTWNVWVSSSLESTAVLFCVQSWCLLATRSTGSWESSTRSHLQSCVRSWEFSVLTKDSCVRLWRAEQKGHFRKWAMTEWSDTITPPFQRNPRLWLTAQRAFYMSFRHRKQKPFYQTLFGITSLNFMRTNDAPGSANYSTHPRS